MLGTDRGEKRELCSWGSAMATDADAATTQAGNLSAGHGRRSWAGLYALTDGSSSITPWPHLRRVRNDACGHHAYSKTLCARSRMGRMKIVLEMKPANSKHLYAHE